MGEKVCNWPLILLLLFFAGCGPQFLRNAHNYKPQDKPYLVRYWACESSEEYFWGDCNWSYGLYLPINGTQRLVGISFCPGSALDYGYALNAVFEDRDRYGPLEQNQLGSQPNMHCKVQTTFMTFGDAPPIDQHVRTFGGGYARVKGATYIGKDVSLSVIGKDDNTTELRGHEALHGVWEGDWHGANWTEENFINTLGLQPAGLEQMPRQHWINPDPPPMEDYNSSWSINRKAPKGIPYQALQ